MSISAPRKDAATALKWVQDQGRLHDLDPTRIALCGDSSGGHIALAAAVGTGIALRHLGLINKAVPAEELDARVDAFADRLAASAGVAIRTTKMSVNIGLKQLAASIMDACLAMENTSNATADHQEAVTAFAEGRTPRFTGR